MPAEVVAQITDQPAGERQVERNSGFAESRQSVAKALQEMATAFIR